MVGVFHGPVLERVAAAMQAQGYRRGLAVQGTEGAVDVLTNRRTPIMEFTSNDTPHSWQIDPALYGGWSANLEAGMEITPKNNATLTRELLDPTSRPEWVSFRRSTLLTAALMVYASGRTETFAEALDRVHLAYTSGDPLLRLTRWQKRAAQLNRTPEVHHA
jgi:anthranilate phosphoribosyltransferase